MRTRAAFHLHFHLLGCLALCPLQNGRPSITVCVAGKVASGPQAGMARGAGHARKILGDFMGFALPICHLRTERMTPKCHWPEGATMAICGCSIGPTLAPGMGPTVGGGRIRLSLCCAVQWTLDLEIVQFCTLKKMHRALNIYRKSAAV